VQNIAIHTDKVLASFWHGKSYVSLQAAIHDDQVIEKEQMDHSTGVERKKELFLSE
jgi:hypothetical protein